MSRPSAASRVAWWPRVALAWSAVCAGLGLWWLFAPSGYVLDDGVEDGTSLLAALSPPVGAAVCLALGAAGVLTALALARPSRPGPGGRGAMAAGGALALLLGVAAPDVQVLSVLGYLMALLGGPVLVILLVAGARGRRTNLVLLALIGTVLGVGALGGIGSAALDILGEIRAGLADAGPRPLVVAFLAAGGLLFGMATLSASSRRSGTSRIDAWVDRWGRPVTVVAALCPLPYGLLRMTWLTPWPQGLGPGAGDDLEPGIRLFGVCLGLSALAGTWLTVGLISRWGEVWPAWLPGLRGRPVPVPAAVVPASVVGVALCAASVSLVMMAVRDDTPTLMLMIPAPVWGPALLLAAYAYHRRRTAASVPRSRAERWVSPGTGATNGG